MTLLFVVQAPLCLVSAQSTPWWRGAARDAVDRRPRTIRRVQRVEGVLLPTPDAPWPETNPYHPLYCLNRNSCAPALATAPFFDRDFAAHPLCHPLRRNFSCPRVEHN